MPDVDCDEFWEDALKKYHDRNVTLPMEYTPENIRVLQEMLECNKCGECCRYKEVPVRQYDIHRMLKVKTLDELNKCIYTRKDGSMYMGECPFLKDGECTIYEKRPDVCWLFPIQKQKGLIRYRLKCRPAVQVARKVFKGALSDGKHILLPDLTIKEA